MNRQEFSKQLSEQLQSNTVDISFIPLWFDSVLEQLSSLLKQQANIRHPRHLGDAREFSLIPIFNQLLPSSFCAKKGYAVNVHTTASLEQDCLILDSNTAGALVVAGHVSYYPIESILASVQVKSRLTLSEFRKAIINAVSIKKLLYGDAYSNTRVKDQNQELCYAIFAYDASLSFRHIIDIANELVIDIPLHLRPNLIYILGRGLVLPGTNTGELDIRYDQMFSSGKYTGLPYLGTDFIKDSEAYAFLWFITSIVDHCIRERNKRVLPSYLSYVVRPLCFQKSFEEQLKKEKPDQFKAIIRKRSNIKDNKRT